MQIGLWTTPDSSSVNTMKSTAKQLASMTLWEIGSRNNALTRPHRACSTIRKLIMTRRRHFQSLDVPPSNLTGSIFSSFYYPPNRLRFRSDMMNLSEVSFWMNHVCSPVSRSSILIRYTFAFRHPHVNILSILLRYNLSVLSCANLVCYPPVDRGLSLQILTDLRSCN